MIAEESRVIVYGRNSVEEAIREGLNLREAVVESGKEEKYPGLLRMLREKKIPVRPLPRGAMDKYADTLKHQGIAADLKLPDNIVEDADAAGHPDWTKFANVLVLDGITDTGNLGAIIRSALLFGFEAVVLPKDASARITPQTVKSSAGAVYKESVFYVNNINTVMEELRADSFRVVGLEGFAKESISDEPRFDRNCLVVGSERDGIRKSVRKACDALVRIPTTRRIDSLNASVASAVAMWEIFRKR